MDQELKAYLDGMKQELLAHVDTTTQRLLAHVDGVKQELLAHVDTTKQELLAHVDTTKQELLAHVSAECEKVETKLLTAFHRWSRPMEIKMRGLSGLHTVVSGFDERLSLAEERISQLERGA